MGTTTDKLNYLKDTKEAIKAAIIEKGTPVPDDTTFRGYADKVREIKSGGEEFNLLKRFDGTITEVTPSDLAGLTKLHEGAFEYCHNLIKVELPDSIEIIETYGIYNIGGKACVKLSKNLKKIDSNAISGEKIYCPALIPPVIYQNSISGNVKKIYVPGRVLDDYYKAQIWENILRDKLDTEDEYVSNITTNKLIDFNMHATLTAEFKNFTSTPQITVEVDKPNVINHTERVEGNQIVIDVTSNGIADTVNLTLKVPDKNGYVFTSSCAVKVVEQIIPGTYTVEKMSQDTYGFELNEAGFYESTNKKIANSYAYAKVNIKNPSGLPMHFVAINYGESNYDYGMISAVNKELRHDFEHDNQEPAGVLYYSFKGLSKPSVQTVTYADAIGDCFITVKFRKDGSGDQNNDSLQFKIRFE